jgi:predicted N-acyltransferase
MSPDESEIGPIETRIVSTIREVPRDLWDEKVARGHPFKSGAFMACLEESFPDRRFGYALMSRAGEPVGLAVVTEEPLDLGLLLPPAVGRLSARVRKVLPGFLTLRLGMVGTFETAQRHWWFDADRISAGEFADQLLAALRAVCGRSTLLLVRDFTEGDEEDARLESSILERGFVRLANHPIAIARLDGLSIEEHWQRLKTKSRANVRKKLAQSKELGLELERVEHFGALIDECYPLYLQVHEKSTEFKRNPFPKAFLHALAERMPDQSSLLTLRARDGRLLAFILTGTSGTTNNPFLIGMDYARTRDTPAYYCMLWKELEHAAARGCREVDLGLTSYFVKQTIGAEVKGMTMAARVRGVAPRLLVQPFLPRLLGEKQPERRRLFRVAAGGNGKRS